MKKKILLLFIFLSILIFPVFASSPKEIKKIDLKQPAEIKSPKKIFFPSSIKNKNEIENQNKDKEDFQIKKEEQEKKLDENDKEDFKMQTQEQEESKEASVTPKNKDQEKIKVLNPRSETARQHMSDVATKVEEILTTQTIKGGIGEQVRQIAQEQKTVQEQTQTNLEKVDKRQGWLKLIIGPDLKAIKNMEKIIEENQLRIQKLTELKNQLTNQDEIKQTEEMIQSLVSQNTALQERINFERQTNSLLGWLFRLFVK